MRHDKIVRENDLVLSACHTTVKKSSTDFNKHLYGFSDDMVKADTQGRTSSFLKRPGASKKGPNKAKSTLFAWFDFRSENELLDDETTPGPKRLSTIFQRAARLVINANALQSKKPHSPQSVYQVPRVSDLESARPEARLVKSPNKTASTLATKLFGTVTTP